MSKRVVAVLILLLSFVVVADAAELTKGGKVNGAAPKQVPMALSAGDKVDGPATITTATGETLLVSADGVLAVKAPEKGVELFFVIKGSVRGEIGPKVQVAVPVGWLQVPEGNKAEFYAETMGKARCFVKANKGDLVVGYDKYQILLREGQGIELWTLADKPGDLCFTTHANNPGDVALLAKITGSLDVELVVPKATTGCVRQIPGDKTRIDSDAGSWKGGKIGLRTRLSGAEGQTGTLGPGTFAVINNATGEIEMGFEEVDFQIIERAISLTSEFTALATSNFFGLSK